MTGTVYNIMMLVGRRFSGISEADMRSAVMTLGDVHTLLKRLFNSKTILIGHSLESDLIALKVS